MSYSPLYLVQCFIYGKCLIIIYSMYSWRMKSWTYQTNGKLLPESINTGKGVIPIDLGEKNQLYKSRMKETGLNNYLCLFSSVIFLGFVELYVAWVHSCYFSLLSLFFFIGPRWVFLSQGQISGLIICDKDNRCLLQNCFQSPYLSWLVIYAYKQISFPD